MEPIKIVLVVDDGLVVQVVAEVPTVYAYHNLEDAEGPEFVESGHPGIMDPAYLARIFALGDSG